jgi:predicted peptidase
VANHIALNKVLYQRHNQQHAYIVGNRIRLATETAKSTKKSYAHDFLRSDQQQVFILQIHRDKKTRALQHHRKLKDDQATRNGIEMPTITANNTKENTLIKLMQKSFTRFETILSKQGKQMRKLMRLLTTELNKLVCIKHSSVECKQADPTHKRSRSISQHPENRHPLGVRNPFYGKKLCKNRSL